MEDEETKAAVAAAMEQHGKLVVGDDQKRQEMAMREIQNILAKYDVALVPRAMLSPTGIEFMIETQVIPPEIIEKQKEKQKAKEKLRKAKPTGKRKK